MLPRLLSARRAAALVLALPLAAQDEKPFEAPPITPWRYDEDYSYLRHAGARTGAWWESLKVLPLGADGDVNLSLGADLRAKYEIFENNLWGAAAPPDQDYFWTRALPYGELRVGEGLRAFAQLIAADEFDDEAPLSPIDEDRADILQAFGEISWPTGNGELVGRVGRQVLSYGSARLISTRYGPNVLHNFDLALLRYQADELRVDLFYGRPVDVQPGEFDNETSSTEDIWSVYATTDLGLATESGLDAYYIGYENDRAMFNQGAGHETRHTFGLRFFGNEAAWDWNFELFAQVGSFAGGDIRAWSAASDQGYRFAHLAGRPRLGFKANVVSGDDDPDDADLETFNALFPQGKYFGEIGVIGPFNLINLHPSLELQLAPEWTAMLGSVFYWRESTGDGIYNNGGILLRGDGGSKERFIGTQLDAALTFKPSRMFDVTLVYSTLLPGAFIRDTGPDNTIHFATVETRLLF